MALKESNNGLWRISRWSVDNVHGSAALVTISLPVHFPSNELFNGGHLAISLDVSASSSSYFAVMTADPVSRTITLYVKRSSRGRVSAVLLDGQCPQPLYLSRPAAGILLPARTRRPMFVAAGSGLASGVGLLRRRLLQDPLPAQGVSLLFVGSTQECATVSAAVAQVGLPVDLRLWDPARRGRRPAVPDLHAAMARFRPDWMYVCGPSDFAQMVRDSAAMLEGPVPEVLAECYGASRPATAGV